VTVSALPPPSATPRVRPVSTVALRFAALAVTAVVLAAVHVRRPATFCLLRATTGVPCPFCGGTTAAVRLGRGDLRGALAASPLAVLMLGVWPFLGVVGPPQWWQRRAARWSLLAATLVGAEVWQLLRFGLIGV
jgi:hypothetical protein